MKSFIEWLYESTGGIEKIVEDYLNSDVGEKNERNDCKTVTRAFVEWAKQNGIQAQVLHLAPPSKDFVKKNPQFQGKSGTGDGHIMPVVNGFAIDFTARQFGLNNPYNNPLITPVNQIESVYGEYGYFTDKPEWFSGGKSFYLGSWDSIKTMDKDFPDEVM